MNGRRKVSLGGASSDGGVSQREGGETLNTIFVPFLAGSQCVCFGRVWHGLQTGPDVSSYVCVVCVRVCGRMPFVCPSLLHPRYLKGGMNRRSLKAADPSFHF